MDHSGSWWISDLINLLKVYVNLILRILFLFIVFSTYDVIIQKYGPGNRPSTSLHCSFNVVYECVCGGGILNLNM